MINVTRTDHRSPVPPAGDPRGGILVTLHGQELDAMIRILTVVTRQSIPGIHGTQELGGERPVAQTMLDGIRRVQRAIQADRNRRLVTEWLGGDPGPDSLEHVAATVREALGEQAP